MEIECYLNALKIIEVIKIPNEASNYIYFHASQSNVLITIFTVDTRHLTLNLPSRF